MDTLGPAVLGFPDVARVLYDVAYYVFQHGDVIKNGETVPGVLDGDRWHCQHEMSLVGPERLVLDLDPGGHHAAGKRPTGASHS